MYAVRLFGKGDLRLVEMEMPCITEEEILLKTDAAAICGTDLRMWKNGCPGVDNDHPLTLGHEFAGTIVKTGKKVPFYRAGMRVNMQPNIGCGICDRCVAGNFHLCRDYRAFGINMDGAFAEYVRIPAEAISRGNLRVLSEKMSAEEAALAEPLSCAFNGFSKCHVKPGERALVVGAGAIGVFHAMLLHLAGASVLMNDIQKERLVYCKNILPFIDTYSGNDLADLVDVWTKGRGLDIAVVACPVPEVQAKMPELMNYGGRVNFFGGIPAHKEPVPIDTNQIHYKELYLTGSTRSSIAQFRKVVDFMEDGLINVQALITHRYALKDWEKAFENAGNAVGIKHVFRFEQ